MKPNEYEKLSAMFEANMEALKDNKYRPQCIFKPHIPLFAMAAAIVDYVRCGRAVDTKEKGEKGKAGKAQTADNGGFIQNLYSCGMMSKRLFKRLKAIGFESLTEIEGIDFAAKSIIVKGGGSCTQEGLGKSSLAELAGLMKKNGYGVTVYGKK